MEAARFASAADALLSILHSSPQEDVTSAGLDTRNAQTEHVGSTPPATRDQAVEAEPAGPSQEGDGEAQGAEYVPFNLAGALELALTRPDASPHSSDIAIIDQGHPLKMQPVDIETYGHCVGLAISQDLSILAVLTSIGTVQLHSLTSDNFTHIATLQDTAETQISEYFTAHFYSHYLIVGGRRKSLYEYSESDLDNAILPCDMVVFDCRSGKVSQRLQGHNEEVLRIIPLGSSEILTASEDGYIIRWTLNYSTGHVTRAARYEDVDTSTVHDVAVLSGTGQSYFVSASDIHLILWDTKLGRKVRKWKLSYSLAVDSVYCLPRQPRDSGWKLVTRGIEAYNGGTMTPSTCCLHEISSDLRINTLKVFSHPSYISVHPLSRPCISSHGRYLLAPTSVGTVVVFCLSTGEVAGILRGHKKLVVRAVVTVKSYVISCCDDGFVRIYKSVPKEKNSNSLNEVQADTRDASISPAMP